MDLTEKLKQKEQEQTQEYDGLFWKPAEGEVIQGRVSKKGKTITSYGEKELKNYVLAKAETSTSA